MGKQLSRRTSEAAHGKTSAAARSSTEDATGAAPTAAAPLRDAPIVAALKTAKTESDVAQALDEAARTTAAATGMHAAPTKAAAEPKNYLVCAAAKPRRRQSRPRGRRGYGKRQWRRRQLEDSRNAEASAAKVKIEDRAVVRSAESGEAMVKHGVAAAAVVEDEQEADSRVTLRQLKQSIAEIDKIAKKIKGRLSGAKAREFAEMVERARSAERRIMEARRNVASQSTVAELAHDVVCNRQSSMRRPCMHGVNVREVAECREQEEMKLRKCEQENKEAKVRAVNMRLEWAETLATYEEGAAGEKTAIASGSAVLPLVLAAGWLLTWLAFIVMIARGGVGPWACPVALVLCMVTIWSLKAEEVSQEADLLDAKLKEVGLK